MTGMKTVSLSLAKQLKEAGYSNEWSTFYWEDLFDGNAQLVTEKEKAHYQDGKEIKYWAAPTADEILDRLPWQIKDGIDRGRLVVEKSFFDKRWKVTYVDYGSGGRFAQSNEDENIADSAAKMWLYLKEQNLLEDHDEQ